MKRTLLFFFLIIMSMVPAYSGSRTSANYSIPTDSMDAAGRRLTSANYSFNGSAAGEFGAAANPVNTSTAYKSKNGFVGQLYDIVALSITAPPSSNLNEGSNRQLNAAPQADDTTTLANLDPSAVSWSVITGPIASISTGGLATAGIVYQDTAAIAGGTAQSLTGEVSLTILNVNTDDFDAYSGDQIDDAWQVQYFGEPPNPDAGPNADPDGDGQLNLFEFTAGIVPTDANSRFLLRIEGVAGQPTQRNLIFSPRFNDRTYTVQFRPSLTTGMWDPLAGTSQSDNGQERTVTDLNATGAVKLYRIQITKP